jgi:hypothetical protein
MMSGAYPVDLEVDGAAPQSRLTVFFRILLVIPHAIIVGLLGIVAAVIWFISWFAIAFTGSYPAGMLNFTVNFLHWSARMQGYMWLLTDKYPPFAMGPDSSYPVRLSMEGQVENRNRLTTFWPIRMILAIPHLIIIQVLTYVAYVVGFIAWLIALFTGSVPEGLHNFLAGYLRWYVRAYAYLFNVIDPYPPFSMGGGTSGVSSPQPSAA